MVDYVSALSIDLSLIAPELALAVGAFVLLGVACSRRLAPSAPVLTLIVYGISLYLAIAQWGHQGSGFADMVTCDNFRDDV